MEISDSRSIKLNVRHQGHLFNAAALKAHGPQACLFNWLFVQNSPLGWKSTDLLTQGFHSVDNFIYPPKSKDCHSNFLKDKLVWGAFSPLSYWQLLQGCRAQSHAHVWGLPTTVTSGLHLWAWPSLHLTDTFGMAWPLLLYLPGWSVRTRVTLLFHVSKMWYDSSSISGCANSNKAKRQWCLFSLPWVEVGTRVASSVWPLTPTETQNSCTSWHDPKTQSSLCLSYSGLSSHFIPLRVPNVYLLILVSHGPHSPAGAGNLSSWVLSCTK